MLALTVVGSGVALGQFPRDHPVVPAFSFRTIHHEAAPPAAVATRFATERTTHLGGATTAKVGSTYTLTGRTGTVGVARVTGTVVLRGRWNSGSWNVLARTTTDRAGGFSITIHVRQRGSLQLRLSTPDRYVATGTLTVS